MLATPRPIEPTHFNHRDYPHVQTARALSFAGVGSYHPRIGQQEESDLDLEVEDEDEEEENSQRTPREIDTLK